MSVMPSFPPLFSGQDTAGLDPFQAACDAAQSGVDAGLVLYDAQPDLLRAALVLAPDVPLAEAATMLPLCGIAVQNALGALGPSELPVQLEWRGPIRVNGGLCGGVKGAASTTDPARVPDWLVTGFALPFQRPGPEAGHVPDHTTLLAEGCGGLEPTDVLESWARHYLNWIHRWESDGIGPVHREWSGLAFGLGDSITLGDETGTFLGLDEQLGLLFKTGAGTRLVPLTTLLEDRS